MKNYNAWALEYLEEAQTLKDRIRRVQAEPEPDLTGQRAAHPYALRHVPRVPGDGAHPAKAR